MLELSEKCWYTIASGNLELGESPKQSCCRNDLVNLHIATEFFGKA